MKHFNFFTNSVVKSFRGLVLAALVVLGTASSFAAEVTYTISAKNTLTTTGTPVSGSSATMVETYTTTKQMTSGNSQTLTLSSHYSGYRITAIKMSMKSNASSGAGNLTYAINSGTATTIVATAAFNTTGWYNAWSATYVDVTKAVDITCGSTNTIIKISGTTNSLFCQSYTLTYEPLCTAITPTLSYSASVNAGSTLNPTLNGNTGGGTVTYSSSNTSVLTVNSSTGVVLGVASGTATVTASIAAASTYCAGSATSGTITVNCNSAGASFASGSVSKATTDANFTNTLTTSNTGAKTFSSSNTAVATVNATTGEVDVLTAGSTTISVTQPETSGVCAVNTSYSLTVSSSCTSAATVWDANTVNKTYGNAAFTNAFLSDNTGTQTYASSNTSVATVNATSGLVTITGVGSTTISVTQPETGAYCAVSTSYTLNVTCATLATPASFTAGTVAATTIDFSWASVANASSYTLTYTDGGSTLYKTGVAGTSTQLTGLTPSTQYLITVKAVGNGSTYCNSAESTTADVTTTALPTYTLTWNVNGSTSTTSVVQGNAIGSLPANPSAPASCSAKKFVGWTTAPYSNASVAPTYISTATVPSANTTYYAVFATETTGGSGDYELVTSTAGLEAGGIYTIASRGDAGSGYVLGDYAGGNNFPAAAVTVGAGPTIPTASVVSPLTLGGTTGAWTFEDKTTGNGYYLNPESTTASNYLKSLTTNDAYRNFSISFSSNAAVITNTGKASRNVIMLNGTTIFSCYTSGMSAVYLYKKTAATTYSDFATSCVACNPNTLALTSTTQTINIGSGGTATYDVSTLITAKNGNGAVTYSVTPTTGNTSINSTTGAFSTEAAGTYYVSVIQALGSEGTPICDKTVKDTIVVLAQPVVTIVDVTPLTFTANCGEASVAQSVSVTGYNLTANMTATAPTNFLVSNAPAGTYAATATFTQASGTASGTLYIKANPPAGSANPISGNVTLTSTDASTRTLAVSATVSCTPVHIYFNDKGSVIADSTEYVGGTVTFPANPSCTDANYTFDGWYTATLNDAASYTKITTPYTVTGETTLYAVYKHTTGTSSTSNLTSAIVGGLEAMAYATTYTKDVDSKTWTFTGCYRLSSGDNLQMNSTSPRYIQTPDMGSEITSITINVKRGAAANIGIYTTGGTLIRTIAVTTTAADYTETISGYNQVRIYNSTTGVTNFYSVSVTAGPAATYTTNPLCCPNQLTTPANFAATAGNTQASLSWDAVANASSYNIECTTNPAKSVTGVTGTSTTITGLTNCTAYSFKITAMGDNTTYCQSPVSAAITATPQSAVLTATFNAGTNGTCGTASLTNTCLSNDITLPSATPSVGFAFDGWQVGGAGTVYAGGSTFTLSANVTLVAKYRVLATYAISFMNEGVEVDSLVQIVTEGSAAAVESRTMLSSCSEYTFKGWSTTAITGQSATAPTYYNFATAVTGPVTLYAVYSFVDTSNGGSNEYTLVTNKADLTAGAKVIIGSGTYVMGAQASNNRPGLTTSAANWTKSGSIITIPAASTAAIFTIGVDGANYTFSDGAGYLYAASSSANYLKTQTTLDANGKWTLGAIDGAGKCASVVATGSNTRKTMAMNTNLFSCYSAQSSYGYMYFYKNGAAAEYTTNPICSPMIVVDQTDVTDSISPADFVIGLGGTATSTGHTVFSKNCTSASYVQPVIFGVDKAVFSVNWTRVYLDNGAMDTLYTVSYSPVTGTSHKAFLYFETNDHTVISDTIPLYGEVCTAVVFGSQSATENTITINWTTPSAGSSLHVWNTIAVPNACESAPQPFNQTYVLGTEVTKTVTGLKASGTYYYQATSGTCVSEQRTIVTPAASGVPALTASSSTIEFIREIGKDTTQSVSLSGVYMNNASVSVAITGAGAAAFTTNASITLDATGKGNLNVTYHPTSSQTFVAVATITYTSGCETKTVVVNLVGNVPGIDMVEINEDATGFVIHTDFQGTPDIVLSQEVEHAGSGKVANDLFFSKYYEASGQVKLVGIYNGTNDSIPLKNIRIVQKKAYKATDPDVIKATPTKFRTWSTATAAEVVAFSNAYFTNYKIAPRSEIILFTSVNDAPTMSCVSSGVGFNHDGWFPVGANAATYTPTPNYFGSSSLSFGGDKSVALQRQRANNSWEFIDLIGAGDSIIANGDSTKTITANSLNDDPGWYCPDGVNYKTKEAAPLSTNRHLLIRKNTVVDGLTAVAQNTLDMETLCAEWEGLNVPKSSDNAVEVATSCEHFSAVAEFNYDGYYSSFERVNEDLVTFTPAGATAPGDWVGTFANPTTTFQDTLRCYNLQISVLRYYDMRTPATPVELTKAEVQGYQTDALLGDPTAQAIIAALDTLEAASTQWRVPIIVKNSATVYTDDVHLFRDLSVDTCRTCDVVILNGGTLIKTMKTVNDRDSVRSVIVYNGGRLIVPDGLDYVVNDLQVRAKGDSVGAAFIEGNLLMKNPRVVHDKRVENDKPYFFTLPYDCPISKITQMNGKTMGPYGATWVIKYYDGAQRIQNRGLSNNWKVMDAGATLKAGVGYVLYISSDIYKYVRFPMVANATFTEKNTGKSMDVTQYGHAQAYGTNGTDGTLGWNNVGWNLVGNPYVSYFMAQGAADSIMTGTTILKGRYLPNGGYNENTWKLDDTENVYITVPDAVADGGYLQKRVSLTQLDPFISFFVQADRTGSLNFATSSREQVAKVMRAPVVDYNEVVVNFDVAGKSDKTTIILDKARNTSYEIGQDLLKWKGKWGKTPYLYSFDSSNNPLVFNAMNYDEAKGSVPMAFYMPTSYARYTFSIDRNASNLQGIEHVYLLRNGSNIADLLTTNYTATDLKIKQENKEFAISIQRAAEVVTPVNPTEDDALMPRAITERHEVRVEQLPAEGTVMVMDAVGRTIATRTLTGADNVTFELPVDGVYTITVMTPARNYTLKTVIR